MFFFKSQGWVGESRFSCFIYCYFSFQIFWPKISFALKVWVNVSKVKLFYFEPACLSQDDFDHFENIQSTNWQTMRFKPPPPGDKIGWRVEFRWTDGWLEVLNCICRILPSFNFKVCRPCELQISDFENAAVCCFVVLLTRAILRWPPHF